MEIFFIILLCSAASNAAGSIRLKSYTIAEDSITLSGFSSGGTFAQHMQISHSSLFSGIAVFSHSFYRCGPPSGNVQVYEEACTNIVDPHAEYDTDKVHADIKEYMKKGLIDDTKNLKGQRLYVYSGLRNENFSPDQSLSIMKVYEPYLDNPYAIRTRVQDSVLVMPTDNNGLPCTEIASNNSYIGNCGFNGAFESLNFLLPRRVTSKPKVGLKIPLQPLQTFDQSEFYRGVDNHNMDTTGYLYIPSGCKQFSKSKPCLLHFYFHGCWFTSREFAGSFHARHSGFLEVAEKNNIIVVFPQALSSASNAIGCWDIFGISGTDYATKQGAQVKVVREILGRILGEHKTGKLY